MGSDSDLASMRPAADILDLLGIRWEMLIISAHRTPERMYEYASGARARGICVIIAGAGGAAHLPGMVASMTDLPVIGVPVRTGTLDGLDSLLSIVQMPGGIPVATVAIGSGKNAGLLAARILGVSDSGVAAALSRYRAGLSAEVLENSAILERDGPKDYQSPAGAWAGLEGSGFAPKA